MLVMMPNQNGDRTRMEVLASNAMLIVVSRFIVPPAITIAIGIAGYYLSQQDASLRRVEQVTHETAAKTLLIENTIALRGAARDTQIGAIEGRIVDHEGRIRVLERVPVAR